jgi:Heterokaryon incompatibility protein Het-C
MHAAAKTSDKNSIQEAARSAFFVLGQALHGVQDFYAHTNYVELQTPKARKVTDISIVAPWQGEGRARIEELRTQGLVSGVVFWEFPKMCPVDTIDHRGLAKDSATTASGERIATHLQNISYYRIASYLAREASHSLFRDAFKRWPLLKELNGENVAFEVLIDRRGL